MTTKLQQFFPSIQTRNEILNKIQAHTYLKSLFDSWKFEQQQEFLDFCTGIKGVKILYDSFFKEILNPESTPERLEHFLSALLKQKVKILRILPNDSTRIADESSLLITDLVVELEDGSLANIEIQKIGYQFPGQRCACYSADLLLRQYKRVRSERKKKFSYRDVKNVYTIVLFEHSPSEFHKFPEDYIHDFSQNSSTGLQIELLQKYFLIPLDIFRKSIQNKGINNELEAWLAFLCEDDPEIIISLITAYPEFKPLYAEVYDMCSNIERVMEMFSKELQELDKNTVLYMIDEMQETINKLSSQLQSETQRNQELIKENIRLKNKLK